MISRKTYDTLWRRPKALTLTGEGTVIGIVDQYSWLDHPAYKKNILNPPYLIRDKSLPQIYPSNEMHGAAVLSIAVGKIGVARKADATYCAVRTIPPFTRLEKISPRMFAEEEASPDRPKDICVENWVAIKNTYGVETEREWDNVGADFRIRNHIEALRQLKAYVQKGGRLDVVSMSFGWMPEHKGVDEIETLVNWFESGKGGSEIPVYNANRVLGRSSFFPCGPSGPSNFVRKPCDGFIGIPVDNRLLACYNTEQVVREKSWYYRNDVGGVSWAIPFIAGMFALARQADPEIKSRNFEGLAKDCARTICIDPGREMLVPDLLAMEKALPKPRVRQAATHRF